ncbi:DUF6053 domain-containing protein [Lysobacter yananisis]|uniref:DUF6053 domain-containing protein n=1 Tax=Lysobacter yananisis TaxID=1003114 RepID=UPI003CE5827F
MPAASAQLRAGADRDRAAFAVLRRRWPGSGPEARAVVGGPSGPMLWFQIAATWDKGIGPEGPPTTTA